jgi:Zn-dependent peptidase ImmA (M78 family)
MTTTARTRNAEGSVLALLRDLVPHRRLTFAEALRIAELQANRLKEHFDIDTAEVASEVVTELPRVTVIFDADLPVSGSTHWNGSTWVITLNASEPPMRRRFSLMHEFKHLIDHTTRGYLYGTGDPEAHERAERAADYFAACLLMQKRWVKRLWGERMQSITELARTFGVSTQAMRYRLNQLGLIETTRRSCPPRTSPFTRSHRQRMEAAA